jgi:hypothetical protein
MLHIIFPALSAAALGLFAAKVGDVFRTALIRRRDCDETQTKGSVWSFNGDAAQPERTWLKVQRHGTC